MLKIDSSPRSYVFVVALVILGGIVRAMLDPWLGNTYPFATFLVVLPFVAWRLGLAPSVLALVLSLLAANFFFLEPRYTFTIVGAAAQIGYALDIFCGVAVVFFVESMRRVRHAVLENEKQYRKLIEEMPEAFALFEVVRDEGGRPCACRFLDANPSYEKMVGVSKEELLNKTRLDAFPSDDAAILDMLDDVAMTGEGHNFKTHSTVLDKNYNVYAYSAAPNQVAVVLESIP